MSDDQVERLTATLREAEAMADALETQRAAYATALDEIVNILGPETAGCAMNECEGCLVEMDEALNIALTALGKKS